MSNKQVALITLLGGLAFVLLLYSIFMTVMCDDLVRKISEVCVCEEYKGDHCYDTISNINDWL